MWRYAELVAPDVKEMQQRHSAIQRTVQCVRQVYPAGRVEVTGSSATGLTLPTSDIDLVLLTPGTDTSGKQYCVALLSQLVIPLRAMATGRRVVLIKARVPILTWVDSRSGLPV